MEDAYALLGGVLSDWVGTKCVSWLAHGEESNARERKKEKEREYIIFFYLD